MRDYTNKTIYLGIDVHKKTYSVTAICDGIIVKRDKLKACPSALIKYCKKYFVGAQIESAYEAGFSGFHLHRCLEAEGIKNRVVDAAKIEVAVGDRVKTDKRDSLKIATHLSKGSLKGIHVPSAEQEDRRAVTRIRDTFVRQRNRLACQIKALLFQHGLIEADDKTKVSIKWIKALKALLLAPGLRFALDQYTDMWHHVNAKIKEIDLEIEKQAEEDSATEVVYRSAPGVGPTSARVLANELGDTLQFSNERQLFSYIGFTPSEHSSGEHIRQGNITRQGKPILRKILVQAAWRAIKDPFLREVFNRLMSRVGPRKAIIGIARRLIGHVRACFRKKELYRSPEKGIKLESGMQENDLVSA
jgi:transposase